ncbi:hypothetical protein PVK06_029956 [Gossypium arboreum]|uniref:MADS-box domain-containing protein n=1 Tax=Gossypium arboreum TaxID=29729 RepID=A0ABR0NLZ4_GOSAR|nr:hypothetical protein PVK06_029956 [Gossypium arboreum]
MELTTLCGTEACLVIYSPDEQPPVVWPSHDEFMLQIHQGKMLNDFNVNELDCLIWYVEIMWTDIRKRREYYQRFPSSSAAAAQGYVPLPPPSQSPATTDQIGDAKAMVRGEASSSISSSGAGDSSLAPHLRLQGPSFGASSSVVAEEGPLRPPFSEGSSSNFVVDHLRLPRPPSGGSSRTSPFMIFEFPNSDTDLPEGDNLGLFGGQDVGPGHYPSGPQGSSYPASEFGWNYFQVFSGESSSSSSSGATSDSETEETS